MYKVSSLIVGFNNEINMAALIWVSGCSIRVFKICYTSQPPLFPNIYNYSGQYKNTLQLGQLIKPGKKEIAKYHAHNTRHIRKWKRARAVSETLQFSKSTVVDTGSYNGSAEAPPLKERALLINNDQ